MESRKIYCRNCGSEMDENAAVCLKCGAELKNDSSDGSGMSGKKSKMVAGILAIVLGEFGVDKFYLGYNKGGIARLILTLVSMVLCIVIVGYLGLLAIVIWCLVDAVKIFTGKTLDANGNELV